VELADLIYISLLTLCELSLKELARDYSKTAPMKEHQIYYIAIGIIIRSKSQSGPLGTRICPIN